MPKSDKHSTLARQWQILKLIPSRLPGLTTREIRDQLEEEGYPVTLRTVERDLEGLSWQFGIGSGGDESTRANRWYSTTGKPLEIGSIDLVDAVSLALAGDVLEKVLPGVLLQPVANKIEKARKKLKALNNVSLASWSDKVRYVHGSMELLPPKIQPRIMAIVQSALLENRQLDITYDAFNEKPKQLRLHPLSLVLRGSIPYLVATAFEYSDLRLYAVHRMRKVTQIDEPVTIPADYSIDAYLSSGAMDFTAGEMLKLNARLSDELAIYLSETPLADDQKINFRGGQYHLTATVRDSWQLHFWIMSQGASITVVKPLDLCKKIKQILSSALDNY